MSYSIEQLLTQVAEQTETIDFSDVMQVIADNYCYSPSRFTNGDLINEAGTNEGSCKLFSFAQIHGLSEQQTLACFGKYYRDDVLSKPEGDDHGNIRNFMLTGWDGIYFDSKCLKAKS